MYEGNLNDQEDDRILKLNDALHESFGELHPFEVDQLAIKYSESETTMIEIIKVGKRFCTALHAFDGTLYNQVEFPERARRYLRPGDTLLVTMGFENRIWSVIYSSTCYESVDDVDSELARDFQTLH